MRIRSLGFLLMVILAGARFAGADADDITTAPELVTDRPDQTESSVVIPPGFVQWESGWTYTEEDEDEVETETHEFPGALLRVGVIERLELRLGWDGYVWEETREPDEDGVEQSEEVEGGADASVGFKLFLWEESGLLPETALIGSVTVPVGREGISSERWDPAFRFCHAHTLSEVVSIGWNWGLAWESDLDEEEEDRHTLAVFQYTASVAISLGDRWGMFLEAFGDVPLAGDGGPRHSLDGGFTFLVKDNLQLDAAAGFGLSEDADDWFVGVGVSVRLPR